MNSNHTAAIVSLALVVVLGGTVGGLSVYEERVYEAHAAQLTLGWQSIDFYFFYKIFMSWLNSGTTGSGHIALPAALQSRLAPFYGNDLSVVRSAYTVKLDRLAITDCTRIYFGDRAIVDALRLEKSLDPNQIRWLAHELTHTEQCVRWGGRKNYADTWFRQLAREVLLAILQGRLSAVSQSISGAQNSVIHDNMSMEQEAEVRAAKVVKGWK